MGAAAIRPGHLAERDLSEIDTADLAAAVRVVAGIEQLAAALDLIECPAQLLLRPYPRFAAGHDRRDAILGDLAREQLGEQRREHVPAIEQRPAHALLERVVEPHDAPRYRNVPPCAAIESRGDPTELVLALVCVAAMTWRHPRLALVYVGLLATTWLAFKLLVPKSKHTSFQ